MRLNFRRGRPQSSIGTGLGGLAVGAALAWALDPQRGPRRRSLLKDKAVHAAREATEAVEASARDFAHRGRGLAAEVSHRVSDYRERQRGQQTADEVIGSRVRAKLGHVCSHPGAIEVSCQEGRVEVHGPILSAEAARVLRALWSVRGVREIVDYLTRFDSPEHVPALQGGSEHRYESWAPSKRAAAGVAGVGLLSWGTAQRGVIGTGMGLAGLSLLIRSVTNRPALRFFGIGAQRKAIELQKTVHVNAPVEEVFAFFEHFENFPRFMSHVREVVRSGDQEGRWRWTVTGPAGLPVSWDAEVTRQTQNQLIAWRSVEGAVMRNEGTIRFDEDRGGTRIGIRLSYNPPGGSVGFALLAALGANPKRQLDEDMVRFKSLIEKGKATGREETVTKEELISPHA